MKKSDFHFAISTKFEFWSRIGFVKSARIDPKQNYVASLLHWTSDLDHMSTVKEIMCLNENGYLFATSDLLTFLRHLIMNWSDFHFLDVIAHQVIRIQTDQTQQVFRLVRQFTIQQHTHQHYVLKRKEIRRGGCNGLCHVKPLAEYNEYYQFSRTRGKCISGLPSFLWPRFPFTCDKPVGGHAPTVISIKVHAGPMLNYRAMSHTSELTVSLCHLRLFKCACEEMPFYLTKLHMKMTTNKISCNKVVPSLVANYDITTRA
ncbi:hypothetical protein OUZ56_012631 [Daphnia magna]|uniref:Uncharacterized protein n=1 Tax=Daphnia magna TaxID=35525 RepID=A0ABQ9Z3K6_9CRUS|nr:hypothetical protein OUZ56_012631 [Daphnia magna]